MIRVGLDDTDKRKQDNSRRNKIIAGVLAIGALLIGIALIATFRGELFGMDPHKDQPSQIKTGDEPIIKSGSGGANPSSHSENILQDGSWPGVRKRIMRYKVPAIIVSVVLVALLIGGITFGVLYQQKSEEESLAIIKEEMQRILEKQEELKNKPGGAVDGNPPPTTDPNSSSVTGWIVGAVFGVVGLLLFAGLFKCFLLKNK